MLNLAGTFGLALNGDHHGAGPGLVAPVPTFG